VTEPLLGHAILLLVGLHRLLEVAWARSNLLRLVARGGVVASPEKGDDGFAALVGVQVAWWMLMAAERLLHGARMPPGLFLPLLVAFVAVEALRAWTLATLGRRWTIRVVVLPGETPVRRGPYRFLRHPNYVVVALEVVILPLWLGCFWTLALTALPHALALERRIRREEEAWRAIAGAPLGVARGGGP
jgi:methyltransferase